MYNAKTLEALSISRLKDICKGLSIPNYTKIRSNNRAVFEGFVLQAQQRLTHRRALVTRLAGFRVSSGFAAFSRAAEIQTTIAEIEQAQATRELEDFRSDLQLDRRRQATDRAIRQAQAPAPMDLQDLLGLVAVVAMAFIEISVAVGAGLWIGGSALVKLVGTMASHETEGAEIPLSVATA